ncbi:hypothetical protein MKX03_025882 [Papaver bracteatum]|nr:hypothetical protein MKX03_025882 [Papaver bracteatum]
MKYGKQDEWVELIMEHDGVLIGNTPNENNFSLRIQEIALVQSNDVEGVLSIGKNVEAWTNERGGWKVYFMRFNGKNLTVKLSGDADYVELNTMSVRMAPVWDSEIKSWQVTIVKIESSNRKLLEIVEVQPQKVIEKPLKSTRGSGTRSLLSAEKYASHSSMLSSVIVAWSPPTLHLSTLRLMFQHYHLEFIQILKLDHPMTAILAVGGKIGKVYFWRIHEPRCYSAEQSKDSVDAVLVGLIQAHKTWITAICWELSAEVTAAAPSPVSVLSLTSRSTGKMSLAVGRGSGILELWICHTTNCEFQYADSYNAHGQVVTGLAWGFDGCCLYSCSQDNTIHCWILHRCTLHKASIPSNTLGPWPSTDLPHVSDSCFGLAVSPGNLVFVVARGFDTALLNPMYQARTQKAAVEFFRVGGQHLEVLSDVNEGFKTEPCPDLSQREMMLWEHIIISQSQRKTIKRKMEQWVAINQEQIRFASEVSKLNKSKFHSISEYVTKERCNFCPAPVPFESPEDDSCTGSKNSDGVHDRHKLSRCAASMQVCPTTPLWLCGCCCRWVWKLPPQTLFTMRGYPSCLNSLEEAQVSPKPFCPFCWILLQRRQPEFLLSPSPV